MIITRALWLWWEEIYFRFSLVQMMDSSQLKSSFNQYRDHFDINSKISYLWILMRKYFSLNVNNFQKKENLNESDVLKRYIKDYLDEYF